MNRIRCVAPFSHAVATVGKSMHLVAALAFVYMFILPANTIKLQGVVTAIEFGVALDGVACFS